MSADLVVTHDGSPTLYIEKYDEHYHSIHGAVQESLHVFVQAGLDFKARQQQCIKIFEIGFGSGLNAVLTMKYSEEHHLNVDYYTIELYPLSIEDIKRLTQYPIFDDPNLVRLHQAVFNVPLKINDNFIFTKYFQDILEFKTNILFDIIYFDAFAPSAQPELWEQQIFKKMYNMLELGGCLVTYCAKGVVKRTMKSVGFKVESLPGPKGKREMTRAIKLD